MSKKYLATCLKTLLLLSLISQVQLSAQTAQAADFRVLVTRVAALEAPEARDLSKDFHVLSTQDGAVYRIDRHEEVMIQRLSEIAGLHVPVRLFMSSDLIVALDFLTTDEEASYTDPLLESEKSDESNVHAPVLVPVPMPVPVPKPQLSAPTPPVPVAPTPTPILPPDSIPTPQSVPLVVPPVVIGKPTVREFNVRAWLATFEDHYEPTVLPSLRDAEQIFEELETSRDFSSRSQCYKRAHIWAYRMWHEHRVKSMKVFIFWPKSFRDSHRFKWWFHVAPFVYVQRGAGAQPQELVMDRSFTEGPTEMGPWAAGIMEETLSASELKTLRCPTIHSYQEFANSSYSPELCLFRKVSMYYMQPENVENRDLKNEIQLDYRDVDLKIADTGRKFKWPWQK